MKIRTGKLHKVCDSPDLYIVYVRHNDEDIVPHIFTTTELLRSHDRTGQLVDVELPELYKQQKRKNAKKEKAQRQETEGEDALC